MKSLLITRNLPILIAALAFFAGVTACYQPPPREIQDADYETAELMVRAADRIARVRLDAIAIHEVEAFQQGTGESLGTRPVTYLIFQTLDSFKGSAEEGDTINVAVNVPGLYEFQPEGETIEFELGNEYVVFLKGRARPAGYPSEFGGALWTPNGEPWVAVVDSRDRLEFAVSGRYLRLVRGEAMPFTLDVDGLRFLAGS